MISRYLLTTIFQVLLFSLFIVSCRGEKSTKPPIMPIQNMVTQTSYGPQAPDDFFPDKRATREPVAHTVAQDEAYTNNQFDKGLMPDSNLKNPQWITKFPFKLDMNLLKDGQKNFNIYCAPCHGLSGHNDGLVTQRSGGSIRPTDIHSDAIINMPIGHIYDAVTNGVNNWNMPGFAAQLSTQERWDIVAYVRALQLSEQSQQTSSPNLTKKKGEQE